MESQFDRLLRAVPREWIFADLGADIGHGCSLWSRLRGQVAGRARAHRSVPPAGYTGGWAVSSGLRAEIHIRGEVAGATCHNPAFAGDATARLLAHRSES